MTADRAALLAATDLFGHLDEGSLGWLSAEAIERIYHKNQYIFRVGDPGDWLFVMADGLVKLELSSLAGEEMVLTTVKPPQTFGELALLDGGPRSANAEAVQDSRLICIPRRDILALISRQPQLADSLFRSLGGMLRRLTDQAADQVFLDLPGRVAKLLLALAGDSATGGAEIDVPLTQTDLAQMVGGSRQRVNRILASFEARGLLEVHGRRMVIKRPDQLRERAES